MTWRSEPPFPLELDAPVTGGAAPHEQRGRAAAPRSGGAGRSSAAPDPHDLDVIAAHLAGEPDLRRVAPAVWALGSIGWVGRLLVVTGSRHALTATAEVHVLGSVATRAGSDLITGLGSGTPWWEREGPLGTDFSGERFVPRGHRLCAPDGADLPDRAATLAALGDLLLVEGVRYLRAVPHARFLAELMAYDRGVVMPGADPERLEAIATLYSLAGEVDHAATPWRCSVPPSRTSAMSVGHHRRRRPTRFDGLHRRRRPRAGPDETAATSTGLATGAALRRAHR